MLSQFAPEDGRLNGLERDLLFRTHAEEFSGQLDLHTFEIGIVAQRQAELLPEHGRLESSDIGESLTRRGQPQRSSRQQRLLQSGPCWLGLGGKLADVQGREDGPPALGSQEHGRRGFLFLGRRTRDEPFGRQLDQSPVQDFGQDIP